MKESRLLISVWYLGFSFSNLRCDLSSFAMHSVFFLFLGVSVWFTRSRNEVHRVLDFCLVSKKTISLTCCLSCFHFSKKFGLGIEPVIHISDNGSCSSIF